MARDDSYSSMERRYLAAVRGLLLRIHSPLVRLLARLHVSPHAVSVAGPLLGVLFVCVVCRHPRLSFLIWFLSVAVDAVDGALARYTGRASSFGALVDQFCDHARETLIVAGLARAGALSPLWGSLYPFVYAATNLALFLGNHYHAPVPLAIKSWMVLYPAILLYLLWDRNYLHVAAPLSMALMLLTIVQGLWLLSRAMAAEEG